MKKIFSILVVTFISVTTYAQQDSQFTQYMYNTVTINPAYAGARNVLSVFGMHRTQWVGLDGAPLTNVISINTPIKHTNLGMGVTIINDKIGPSDENSISADISYSIKTSEDYKLAFGMKATANLLNIDFNKLSIYNENDDLASQNVVNRFSPNIGAGLFLSSDKTYFGLAIPNLLETEHFDTNATAKVASEKAHVYLMAGRVYDINADFKFKPSILTKFVKGAPLQADLSANFIYQQKFTLGVAYRWDAAISGLAGFQVNDSWFIGYAYDRDITKISGYSSGSHEIFLRYELFKDLGKAISPRFF
ncbi:MAG: type IX secretion system membrane protein PorP/SprF [Bacteroidota bacterium]